MLIIQILIQILIEKHYVINKNECIDEKLYLKLIKLAEKHNHTPKKKGKTKNIRNTKKI